MNLLKLDNYHDEKYQNVLRKLRLARQDAGLTQDEVAERLGKSQYYVSRSETGERRVDIVELEAFARVYEKPISYFLSDV